MKSVKREIVGIYHFTGSQNYQGTCSHMGNFKLTVRRRFERLPVNHGCETPVFMKQHIATIKLGGKEYIVEPKVNGSPYNPIQYVTLAKNDYIGKAAVRRLRNLCKD